MAVALYARVSTAKQAEKDLSIPDQLRQMRDSIFQSRNESERRAVNLPCRTSFMNRSGCKSLLLSSVLMPVS